MADDDRRAEIEAVILFACPECGKVGSENERCVHFVGGSRGHDHYKRVPVRLPLDRVRDARGDDETRDRKAPKHQRVEAFRLAAPSPQGEDHETARPEQPPPDRLGGQPPAEPPEAP